MKTGLNTAQIAVSIFIILVILLQLRGGGIGGIFGGSQGATFRTRRGFEKTLFRFTIVLAVVFIALSIIVVTVVE